jgi:hypothetical protein
MVYIKWGSLGFWTCVLLCPLEYRTMDKDQKPSDPEHKKTYLWLHSVKLICVMSKKKVARVLQTINQMIWWENVVQCALGLKGVLGDSFITRVIYPRYKRNWYLPDFGISAIINTMFM